MTDHTTHEAPTTATSSGRRVAVSLGAGGARGYAHIGVLEVLAERGHEIVTIAGTSMGALVGGVAAAGRLPAYTAWARSLTQREVLRLIDPTLSGAGAIRLERVIAKVTELVEDKAIEDLPIPFTAVATDLLARREVWFQHGPLETAIRASISIPGVIAPVVVDSRLLVDGGLLNPVPIEPTTAVHSDFTVAVSLAGYWRDPSAPAPSSPVRKGAAARHTVRELTGRLRPRSGLERSEPLELHEPPRYAVGSKEHSTTDVVSQSYDAMSALITRFRMAANPPDVLVEVPTEVCRVLDFHRADEVIAIGRDLAERALDDAGY